MTGGEAPVTNGQSFQLAPHPRIQKPKEPLLVIVLDGWGEAEDDQYNAISRADTPCMDSLKKGKPDHWMLLKAHGTAVRPSTSPRGSAVGFSNHLLQPLWANLGHQYQNR